jgi:hypothetical protein
LLIAAQGWRTAQLIIGVAAAALLIPASLPVRWPPSVATSAGPGSAAGGTPAATAMQALKSPQFAVLAFTFFGDARHIRARSFTR